MRLELELPDRPAKPRRTGRTSIIDKGVGVAEVQTMVRSAGVYVDMVKFGWGTSLVDLNLAEKIEIYHHHDIEVCFGGTLFELVHLQGKVDEYAAWLRDLGVGSIEISDGTLEIDNDDKQALVSRFATDFRVFSEVGSKDSQAIVSPARWVTSIRAELSAGAEYVILEGRESGTAGLYRPSGEIRTGLIDEILDAGIDTNRLVFEAPTKTQQTYLLGLIGPNANLANIPFDGAVALETLRLGLRSDTLLMVHDPG